MVDLENEQLILLLTVVLVIIALITIFQSFYYQKKKKLQFILGPSFSLVNIKESYKEKIRVLYENTAYDDLSSIQITIRNFGNEPISKEDLIVPIKFNFDKQIKIIDWKIISTKPEELIANISQAGNVKLNNNKDKISIDNEFHCDFELLNPKYEIKLQFVCVGGEIKNPTINATMIKGISSVDIVQYEEYLEEKNVYTNMKNLFLVSILGIGLVWVSTLIKNPYIIIFLFPIGLITFVLSMTFLIFISWRGIIKDIYSSLKRKVKK